MTVCYYRLVLLSGNYIKNNRTSLCEQVNAESLLIELRSIVHVQTRIRIANILIYVIICIYTKYVKEETVEILTVKF